MLFKKEYKEKEDKLLRDKSQLIELNYNCTECASPIEILSINEKECSVEFKCINNNHKLKMRIKEYINKMKAINNKNIYNDICYIHNKKYECYCLDCNKHLCKDCLILREHISHNKYNIVEIKPNTKELNMLENTIKYYENKIYLLENEKVKKTKDLNNKLKDYKQKLIEKKELNIKESKIKLEKELKLRYDTYITEINEIRIKYKNELKLSKIKYEKSINKAKNKYQIENEYNNIIYKKATEKLNNEYLKIIQKYNFNEKIDNMNYIKILNQIIYNTYNIYNNNYFS